MVSGNRLHGPLGPMRRLVGPMGCCRGILGWNGTTRYEIANAGAPGAAEMSRVSVFRVDTVGINSTNVVMARGTIGAAATSGWEHRVLNAGDMVQWAVINTALATILSPGYAIVAGDQNKIIISFMTLDATVAQLLKAFHAPGGVVTELGAPGTACVGYTPAVATDDFAIGCRPTSGTPAGPCDDLTLIAQAGSDTNVWTAVEMQAIVDNILANCGRIETAVPGETFRFNANDVEPPANWVGDAGGTAVLLGAVQASVARVRFVPVYQ